MPQKKKQKKNLLLTWTTSISLMQQTKRVT